MASIRLMAEPISVGLARDFVGSLLADRELDTFAVVLLASELVTNVVRHAETDFTVTIDFESSYVRVEVHDGVAATDAFRELVRNPPRFADDSLGGRGLPLVANLANRFGLDDEPGIWNGKIVWFELEAAPVECVGETRTPWETNREERIPALVSAALDELREGRESQ